MSRRIPTRHACALSAGKTELPFGYYPVDTSRVWRGPKTGVGPISASPSRSHRRLRWPEPKGSHLALPAQSPALRLPAASAVAFAPREKTQASGRSVVHVDHDFASCIHRATATTGAAAFCPLALTLASQFCGSMRRRADGTAERPSLHPIGPVGDSGLRRFPTVGGEARWKVGLRESRPMSTSAGGSFLASTPLALLASV